MHVYTFNSPILSLPPPPTPTPTTANNGADDQARRLTNTFDSVFLDLGGSTVSRVV